jgi:restriction system protein
LKIRMAKNSLFAVLLRSRWWISAGLAVALTALAMALLPPDYRVVGALSALPFYVIAALAARRQWALPSDEQVAQTAKDLSAMAWPAFSQQLEDSFRRDGWTVQRGQAEPVDFELERAGRRMVVHARRWKSSRLGLEPLRALQAAREAREAPDALCISLGELSDTARPFAARQRIAIWQAAELAQVLRGRAPALPQGQ